MRQFMFSVRRTEGFSTFCPLQNIWMETIQNFYSGRSVLVTGATGFMGKVLVEKLLRSCPDVAAIYVVVRKKRNKSAEERWNELTNLELFDKLKNEFPQNLDKVKVLDGQIHLKNFGLESKIYEEVKKNVSVIFHMAASVRFDDTLKKAFESNVYATINVINFALESKKIEAFLHVSTTYSNTHVKYVEEKVYPPVQNWREVAKIIEETDPETLVTLTQNFIHPFVNTYVFTKHLAEQVVDEYKDRIPMAIVRPSIVISSYAEPIYGWVDNLNGPFALMVGACKGVMHCALVKVDTRADFIPVDISVKSMIVAAWKKGVDKSKFDIDVYNSSSIDKSVTFNKIVDIGMAHFKITPNTKVLWEPSMNLTGNLLSFRIQCFYKHLIPSLFFDTLLKLNGQKPRLFKIHKKAMNAMLMLRKFTSNEWTFANHNFLSLIDQIPPESKSDFDYSFEHVDVPKYIKKSIEKFRPYILRENDSTESILKHNKMMHMLDVFMKMFAYFGAAYAAYCFL